MAEGSSCFPGGTPSRSSSGWRLSIGRRGAQPNIARRGVSATRSVVETGAFPVRQAARAPKVTWRAAITAACVQAEPVRAPTGTPRRSRNEPPDRRSPLGTERRSSPFPRRSYPCTPRRFGSRLWRAGRRRARRQPSRRSRVEAVARPWPPEADRIGDVAREHGVVLATGCNGDRARPARDSLQRAARPRCRPATPAQTPQARPDESRTPGLGSRGNGDGLYAVDTRSDESAA